MREEQVQAQVSASARCTRCRWLGGGREGGRAGEEEEGGSKWTGGRGEREHEHWSRAHSA